MNTMLIQRAVRLRLMLTPRRLASHGIRRCLDRYLALARSIDPAAGRRSVRVPPMLGVDADMRDWSFYMILEHDVIVNRFIHGVVDDLAHGVTPAAPASIDMQKDVMPSADPGAEQVTALRTSVEGYLETIARLPRSWPSTTARHPLFGQLTARGWHGMFGFHLEIHLRQAAAVVRIVGQDRPAAAD